MAMFMVESGVLNKRFSRQYPGKDYIYTIHIYTMGQICIYTLEYKYIYIYTLWAKGCCKETGRMQRVCFGGRGDRSTVSELSQMDVSRAVLINTRVRELFLAHFIYFWKQPERTSTSIPELS